MKGLPSRSSENKQNSSSRKQFPPEDPQVTEMRIKSVNCTLDSKGTEGANTVDCWL